MHIAIPLYTGYDAADALGPYFVLRNIPGATVTFVAEQPGVIADGGVTLTATASFADLPAPDVLVVPGTKDVKQSMAIQLGLEYAPRPPFNAGTPKTAPAEITERVRSFLRDA